MAELVITEVKNRVGFLKMNRPDKLNALSRELVSEMLNALNALEADPEVKVIVLQGEGRAFSAGGDIASMKSLSNAGEVAAWIEYVSSLSRKIMDSEKYIIAAVHGFAAGAGFSLALAADFIVAKRDAKFALSFSNIGLIPDLGLIKALSECIPPALAKEWISSAKTLSTVEAEAHGIINRIADKGIAESAAEFANFIVEGPPLSNKYVKYMVNHVGDLHQETAFMQENMIQAMLLQTDDHKEGVSAFFEKRQAEFSGQ